MALTKERKGEIALALLRNKVEKEGVNVSKNTPRDLGNIAKETGIELSELKEFAREFALEMVEKHLS